jgi:hypothetical protein
MILSVLSVVIVSSCSGADQKMKEFKLSADEIAPMAPGYGACFATDHITVDGKKVGYMYRDEPDRPEDSGWRFFSGEETQAYVDDPDNTMIYDVNTIANYDPAIIPFLDAPPGSAYGRVGETFVAE